MWKFIIGLIVGWIIGRYISIGPDDDNPWDVWDDPWNLK